MKSKIDIEDWFVKNGFTTGTAEAFIEWLEDNNEPIFVDHRPRYKDIPFSADRARNDSGVVVVTDKGASVRIICWDRMSENPIVALATIGRVNDAGDVEEREFLVTFNKEGVNSHTRLMLRIPVTYRDMWIISFRVDGYRSVYNMLFQTRELAENWAMCKKMSDPMYHKISIEV